MTKMTRCKCNVVINELLAFVQNKIGVIEDERLALICNRGFTAVDIQEAKDFLNEILPKVSLANNATQRNGRKLSATQEAMEEIVHIVKTYSNEIPIFVARDLVKIPPLAFDQTGVTRLLREIVAVKAELETLRKEQVSEVPFQVVPQNVASRVSFPYPNAAASPKVLEHSKPLPIDDSPPLEATLISQVVPRQPAVPPIQFIPPTQQVIAPIELFIPPTPEILTPLQLYPLRRKKRIKLDLKPNELIGKSVKICEIINLNLNFLL